MSRLVLLGCVETSVLVEGRLQCVDHELTSLCRLRVWSAFVAMFLWAYIAPAGAQAVWVHVDLTCRVCTRAL